MIETVRRRQATLFLNGQTFVDDIRQRFNPEQAKLIASHVTLIREDEVADWAEVGRRLSAIDARPVTLHFVRLERRDDLLMLTCGDPTFEFDDLPTLLLADNEPPRKHEPHITLIHTRNGRCTDEVFGEIESRFLPFSFTFDEVSFIEQTNGGKWTVLDTFRLA